MTAHTDVHPVVAEVTRRPSGRMGGYAAPVPLGEVVLRPVGGKGNEEWASATPVGEFKMTVRGEALGVFLDIMDSDRDVEITMNPVDRPAQT